MGRWLDKALKSLNLQALLRHIFHYASHLTPILGIGFLAYQGVYIAQQFGEIQLQTKANAQHRRKDEIRRDIAITEAALGRVLESEVDPTGNPGATVESVLQDPGLYDKCHVPAIFYPTAHQAVYKTRAILQEHSRTIAELYLFNEGVITPLTSQDHVVHASLLASRTEVRWLAKHAKDLVHGLFGCISEDPITQFIYFAAHDDQDLSDFGTRKYAFEILKNKLIRIAVSDVSSLSLLATIQNVSTIDFASPSVDHRSPGPIRASAQFLVPIGPLRPGGSHRPIPR